MKTLIELKKLPKQSIFPRSVTGNRINRLSAAMNRLAPQPITQLPEAPVAAPAGQYVPPPVASAVSTSNTQEQINAQAQILANQLVAAQQQSSILNRNGRTYTKFDTANDIIAKQVETVTAAVWSTGVASLITYFTSSAQTTDQRRYYVDVLNGTPGDTTSQTQFSIAYGHALGSGSDSVGQLNDSPSRAIYGQYRQLLLGPTDSRFSIGEGASVTNTNHIYAINFKRSLLKERLDPGNFQIPLRKISGSRSLNATGSNCVSSGSQVFTLIDDSSVASPLIGESGRVYNLVSGSINSGIYNPSSPVYYGLAYPDYGTIILDGNILDANLNFQSNTGSSSEGNNHFALYQSLSGSGTIVNPITSDNYGFEARNSEKITSTHYFVRIKNAEYNFSNNPSYVTGSVGELREPSFRGDPKTYVTTIGLYNNNQELLAVAKLSKPLLKSFQREALIRVKLDF